MAGTFSLSELTIDPPIVLGELSDLDDTAHVILSPQSSQSSVHPLLLPPSPGELGDYVIKVFWVISIFDRSHSPPSIEIIRVV